MGLDGRLAAFFALLFEYRKTLGQKKTGGQHLFYGLAFALRCTTLCPHVLNRLTTIKQGKPPMIRHLAATAAVLAAIAFAPAAHAAPVKYDFDKAHTSISFKVNHLGFSNSIGRFMDWDGHILFDAANPAGSSVEVKIKAPSVFMGTDAWDKHLKNADFLNVEKFPTIDFKSTKVDVTGEKTADITGDLTILGVTKPVVLKTVMNGAGKHPMSGKETAGFTATTAIKRSEFGMNYGLPNVGDDVAITIEVEANAAETTEPKVQ